MRSSLLAAILLFSLLVAMGIGALFLFRAAGSTPVIDSLPRDTSLLVRLPDPSRLLHDVSRTALAAGGEEPIRDWLLAAAGRGLDRSALTPPSDPESARMLEEASSADTVVALVPGDDQEPAGIALVAQLGRAAPSAPPLV